MGAIATGLAGATVKLLAAVLAVSSLTGRNAARRMGRAAGTVTRIGVAGTVKHGAWGARIGRGAGSLTRRASTKDAGDVAGGGTTDVRARATLPPRLGSRKGATAAARVGRTWAAAELLVTAGLGDPRGRGWATTSAGTLGLRPSVPLSAAPRVRVTRPGGAFAGVGMTTMGARQRSGRGAAGGSAHRMNATSAASRRSCTGRIVDGLGGAGPWGAIGVWAAAACPVMGRSRAGRIVCDRADGGGGTTRVAVETARGGRRIPGGMMTGRSPTLTVGGGGAVCRDGDAWILTTWPALCGRSRARTTSIAAPVAGTPVAALGWRLDVERIRPARGGTFGASTFFGSGCGAGTTIVAAVNPVATATTFVRRRVARRKRMGQE